MDDKTLTTTASGSTEMVQIAAMQADLAEIKEVLAENLGAGGMSEFDLQKITTPAGGGIAFTVTDLDGEKPVAKIRAVILVARDGRTYWKDSLEETGGGAPPDCHSNDAITGIGTPGGDCISCPMAQFGSADKGKGQACKQTRQLFLLREGAGTVIPEVFSAPPTSLKAVKQYGILLAGRGAKFCHVITEIGLEKARSTDGVNYAKATFKPVRALSAEEKTRIAQLAAVYAPLMNAAVNVAAQPASVQPASPDPAFE